MAVKIEIEAVTQGFRRARNEMDGLGKSVKGLGDGIKAMLGLELAEYFVSAAKAAREFALAGVDASRVAAGFRGNLDELRKASGNAIDDTSLQRLDTMARKTGLASSEIASLTRLATKFSRESGQEMAATFQQLIDASPEQMEKWGILTSELTEELKGLDTVAQKAVLRQALIAEGAAITNAEIEAQTHSVETLSAQWDNAVSSMQEWTAAAIESDGARDVANYVTDSVEGLNAALVASAEAWYALDPGIGAVARSLEEAGAGMDLLTEAAKSALGPLVTFGNTISKVKSALETNASNTVLNEIENFKADEQARGWRELRDRMLDVVNIINAQENAQENAANAMEDFSYRYREANREYIKALEERRRAENLDDLDSGELMGKDPKKRDRITLGAKKPSRGRSGPSEFDKAIASTQQKILDGWVQFRQDWAFQRWEAQKEFEAESIAMFESVASIVTGVAEGVLPDNGAWEQGLLSRLLMGPEPETTLEMMARFTGELDSLSASWSNLTTGMGSGADQVKGVIDAFSTLTAASPQLEEAQGKLGKGFDKSAQAIGTYASTGISAISAFTGAFVEDQKVQAGLMSAFEAAMALASWPDPVGIATHAAASALFGAVAAGAFDGGGGGSARGGAQAGAAFGAPTLADAFDGGGAGETQETTVIQLQVDGRTLGEASLRGANDVSSTFRRGETLQADAVGAGRKGLF